MSPVLELTNVRLARDYLRPDDLDAIDYIARVEAADGQELEPSVKIAINQFIKGCKADGNWNAIKASCIMVGARTLPGALVPLKGAAPTNFNFVSGDYDRKTGLQGDGSTKYLMSNLDVSAVGVNNHHLAVNKTTTNTLGDRVFIGTVYSAGSATLEMGAYYNQPDPVFGSRSATSSPDLSAPPASANFATLYGISRSSSTNYTRRYSGSNTTIEIASQNLPDGTFAVFSRTPTSAATTNARLSFYSIGESLDLALLDARVTALMNELRWGLDGITDPDAISYLQAVETADGQTLETATRQAIQSFIVGCKADGIWNAIKASCIMAGARTLAGALVPLKGTAPTNYNFVSGDYDRKTGLKGDGSTKYLDSAYAFPVGLQNNCHSAGWFSVVDTIGVSVGAYGDASSWGSFLSCRSARLYNSASDEIAPSDTTTTGFRGTSRASSANFVYRRAGSNETATIDSVVVTHQNLGILARRRHTGAYDAYSNARLSFYSIGEALDLALLDARVSTLMSAFTSVIP